MYSKLFIFTVALMCINAHSIGTSIKEKDAVGELKVETFSTNDEAIVKVAAGVATITPKVVWSVYFFSVINGQQLVGYQINQLLVPGTNRVTLNYNSGTAFYGRITYVFAQVDIPATNSITQTTVYTRQLDRTFQGVITFNSAIQQNGYLTWYVYAIQ